MKHMGKDIKVAFTEDAYIEQMNISIRDSEDFLEGMVVEHIGGGIALTKDGKDITTEQPIMLSVAHDKIAKQANEKLEAFRLKLVRT